MAVKKEEHGEESEYVRVETKSSRAREKDGR